MNKRAFAFLLITGLFLHSIQARGGQIARLPAVESGDTVAAGADAPQKRTGVFRWIRNYLVNTNKHEDRPFDFSLLFGPSYSAATSVGLGGMASGLYSWDRSDPALPKSNVSLFANASLAGMFTVGLRGNNFLPHERYRLNYKLYIYTTPSDFWGIGFDKGAENANKSEYSRIKFQFKPDFLVRLSRTAYAGVVADIEWVNSYGFTNPALLEGQDKSIVNYGVGLNLTYDSRDFILNAYSGHYLCLEQMFYPKGLGNTYAFSYSDVTYSTYHKVWKGGVLAFELHGLFNYGDVPWTMLAQVGVQGRMRGYYEGRYRDRNIIEAQLELRQRIKGRHGMAFFVGAANVFRNFDHIYCRKTLPNYGLGYRWEFKKRVNIRFDLGFTRDNPNLTFNVNEAF